MTNEEAIEQLKNYHYENGTVPQEIIMAIEALRKQSLIEKMKKAYYKELKRKADK